LLLVAGHETTTNLIGNGVHALFRHPQQLELLREHPDFIDRAIEEFLRYDSPVQLTARIALSNSQINGHEIPKGTLILILIGSANRDPQAHLQPEMLDITREPTRHLAFGQGIHFCLSAPLDRLEAQIAFRLLLQHFENFTSAGEPTWKENAVLRGMINLPATTQPG
jgi:cytochrome P450